MHIKKGIKKSKRYFLRSVSVGKRNELFHSKGNHKQNENPIYCTSRKYLQMMLLTIPKIYNGSYCSSIKKKKSNTPIRKWAENLNRHFFKEDIQMAKRYMKKRFNTVNYQRNKNQNHNDLTMIRMAIIKKFTNNKCWRGYKGTLKHCL